jgi:hypothetical protein
MARPLTAALLLAAAAAAGPASAAPTSRFPVQLAGRGAQRLDVPLAFVSASARGDLADLRLRDATGAEVPYLLVPPPQRPASWVAAQRIRPLARTKTESGAELDLGAVQTVGAVEIGFHEHGFLKRVRLEGSADGARYTVLSEGETLYDLPLDADACGGAPCGGPLLRRELRFAPSRVRWLRLVLDDRRSARLGPPSEARALVTAARPWDGPVSPVEFRPQAGEPRVSRFTLRLPGPHLPVVAVRLEVDAPRLARRARVLEARLSGSRLTPFELGSGTLLRVERDGAVASSLRIPVSTPEETELELVVEDGDNPPLALGAASVELAPLPWIYFESRSGDAIEATLGDPELRAPSYDLEALRPELEKLAPSAARAGAALAAPAQPSDQVADPVGPGAPLDPKPFREARSVAAAPPGLAAVALDAPVLARSDLADLRLRAPDGRQLPYLLEQRDEPLPIPLSPGPAPAGLPERIARAGVSAHALPLSQPRFPASRLVLETNARVFTRAVRVYLRAGRDETPHQLDPLELRVDRELHGFRPVTSATWTHADPNHPAPPLTLELPQVRGRELLVTLDDGDNAPLPLTAARLLLPSYRLRFFHPGPAVQLLYAAQIEAPRYDLELIAPRLRAAPAREVALGDGVRPGDAAASRGAAAGGAGRIVFWVVLALAVVGLLALVARLVIRGTPPAA